MILCDKVCRLDTSTRLVKSSSSESYASLSDKSSGFFGMESSKRVYFGDDFL